jgi:hypothetical protein
MKYFVSAWFLILIIVILISKATATTPTASPSLGVAETFGIISHTYTNGTVGTVINGDVGYVVPP